ncbi:hypothetical protein JCM19231_5200 [Vibrio ishigakensis]|uniref:Uncharacterized protein n=1 Tax=Vibrio ishigakensis TaxID=1481914 RepID=A0A0B8NRP4_9VIBR|nr:hypothetical protein [Vibrio ishigakensis]GAM56621.1 hypothetical protein JCM19231_5200 [Vibrio ishigakensis]
MKGAYTRIIDSENHNNSNVGSLILRSTETDGYKGTEVSILRYNNFTFDTFENTGRGSSTGNPHAWALPKKQNLDKMLQLSFISDLESEDTVTDIFLVSGTQQQSGTETNAYGEIMPNGYERFSPSRIDYGKELDTYIDDVIGDLFSLSFIVPEGVDINSVEPARYDDINKVWVSEAYTDGYTNSPYSNNFLEAGKPLPSDIDHLNDVERYRIHGQDTASRMIWFLANKDGKYALVKKN